MKCKIWQKSLTTLQRQNAENLKQIFPEKEYRGLSPNFHIHVYVSELYIYSHDGSAFSARDRSWEYINRSQTQNVEIGAEATQFLEKEYINGIAVAM